MWASLYLLLSLSLKVLAVWPAPRSFDSGHSVLWIEPDVQVTYNGGNVRMSSSLSDFSSTTGKYSFQFPSYAPEDNGCFSSKTIVQDAVKRAFATIFTQNLIPWKFVPRNNLSDFEPSTVSTKNYINSLTITQTGTDNFNLLGDVDESYNLTVTGDGKADIIAVSANGCLHALQTFIQLFYQHSEGTGMYTNLVPLTIVDAPKFKHRGLNMDVSRNWYEVIDILRTIDALAWNKFNRFHIHMSDGQSWPMEIPALPELSQKGAYAKGLTYSPADIQQIHEFAVQRGVEVIIEFDMPGHTTAIGFAYPNLLAAFYAKPWTAYCAEPPCGTLQLNNPDVSVFLEKLFDDVLPRVRPYTSYFHTGGDEVNLNAYLLDPTVKSDKPKVLGPLVQKFVDRNHDQIRAAGLTPIVWEEMLVEWNLTLGDDVVVQSWRSGDSVAKITAKGFKTIAGNNDFWYLDCGTGQWLDFENGAPFDNFYPFNDYCSPTKSWRLAYSYDPLAGVAIENQHLILGGEAHIWSEQTDPSNLDTMIWPRAGAVGEVLWSGRQDTSGQNRSQVTASPRLAEMRERMVNRGVRVGPVQMVFCTQDKGECTF